MVISWCIIAQYAPFLVWYERDIFLPPPRLPKWRMLILLQIMILMGIHVEKTHGDVILLLFPFFSQNQKRESLWIQLAILYDNCYNLAQNTQRRIFQ